MNANLTNLIKMRLLIQIDTTRYVTKGNQKYIVFASSVNKDKEITAGQRLKCLCVL